MTASNAVAPPTWFRVVSVVAMLWMLFGLFALWQDVSGSEAMRSQMSDVQLQLYDSRPGWLVGIYAVAIISGLAGAIGLVMRRLWAVPALTLSLLAAVIQFGYTFTAMRAIELLGPSLALPFPMVILAIGIGLVLVGRKARESGWLV